MKKDRHIAEQRRKPLPHLSLRQRQVLAEIAKGYLNKEIAARLGVSTETVRTYLKIIYERLDVHSRTEAVVKFLHAEGREP